MLIYLLRHGLTAYNAEKRYQGQRDIPLSPAGRAQLRQADLRPETVYITPLCRTRQTAEVLFPGARLVDIQVFSDILPRSDTECPLLPDLSRDKGQTSR